jgi:hypothetical protein
MRDPWSMESNAHHSPPRLHALHKKIVSASALASSAAIEPDLASHKATKATIADALAGLQVGKRALALTAALAVILGGVVDPNATIAAWKAVRKPELEIPPQVLEAFREKVGTSVELPADDVAPA